jgi:hypothetical protein
MKFSIHCLLGLGCPRQQVPPKHCTQKLESVMAGGKRINQPTSVGSHSKVQHKHGYYY